MRKRTQTPLASFIARQPNSPARHLIAHESPHVLPDWRATNPEPHTAHILRATLEPSGITLDTSTPWHNYRTQQTQWIAARTQQGQWIAHASDGRTTEPQDTPDAAVNHSRSPIALFLPPQVLHIADDTGTTHAAQRAAAPSHQILTPNKDPHLAIPSQPMPPISPTWTQTTDPSTTPPTEPAAVTIENPRHVLRVDTAHPWTTHRAARRRWILARLLPTDPAHPPIAPLYTLHAEDGTTYPTATLDAITRTLRQLARPNHYEYQGSITPGASRRRYYPAPKPLPHAYRLKIQH